MKSLVHSCSKTRRPYLSTRQVRWQPSLLLTTIAICGGVMVAPHLRSAMTDAAPTFTQTNIVSDVAGLAAKTDSILSNPWGMALGLNGGVWVADNGSGLSTTYDGKGQSVVPQVVIVTSGD